MSKDVKLGQVTLTDNVKRCKTGPGNLMSKDVKLGQVTLTDNVKRCKTGPGNFD